MLPGNGVYIPVSRAAALYIYPPRPPSPFLCRGLQQACREAWPLRLVHLGVLTTRTCCCNNSSTACCEQVICEHFEECQSVPRGFCSGSSSTTCCKQVRCEHLRECQCSKRVYFGSGGVFKLFNTPPPGPWTLMMTG